jgi:hydrogenase-4 component B
LSAALTAACFVKAYGVTFLGRPRSAAAEKAHEVDYFSLAAMYILAAICLFVGIFPGAVIDLLAPVVQSLIGGRLPVQTFLPWASIVPIAESRSSYNGLIILFFLVCSGTLTALVIHRYATRATRRSAIWDCGYPDPSTATQYSSSSFAMPIRRVFGSTVFYVRETVDMPRPGEMRAARFHVKIFDPAWRLAYGPIVRRVLHAATVLNQLQFLTIRSYLTLVFGTLIALLLVVAAWR